MKTRMTRLLYLILLFPLISACVWFDQIFGTGSTATPVSDVPPAPAVAASPTIAAEGPADFHVFAADIATAIQDKNASFFGERSSPQIWNCLGDETQGVCQGRPAGDVLQGIPVTHDWATYRVYNVSDYNGLWQDAFAQGNTLTLVAVASQFGDNPLMPMAEQSFLAVITVAGHGAQAPDNLRLGLAPLYTSFAEVWDTVDRIRAVSLEKRCEKYPQDRLAVT